jgi:hydrogenase maturation protease
MEKRTAIVGIGNILMSDDGVGVFAVRELQKRYTFPESVKLIDGGTKSLELLPYIEGMERVLFIDAVDFNKHPGYIGELSGEKISEYFSTKLSVHQIALPDLIGVGRLTGMLTEELHLVGIQPLSVNTGYGLTEPIRARVDRLIEKVIEKLKQWNIYPEPRTIESV